MDPGTLPEVDIDPGTVTSSVTIDDAAERRRNPMRQSKTFCSDPRTRPAEGDPDLATAALGGTRLDQATQQIESDGDTATATQYIRFTDRHGDPDLVRPPGPPRLAVRVTGEFIGRLSDTAGRDLHTRCCR